MNITKSQLNGLSKSQINDLVGASFHPEIEAFCNQCNIKSLTAWILSTCIDGSFSEGMKALAERRPTQMKTQYSQAPHTFYDAAGNAVDHFITEAYAYECPSLWVLWLDVIQEQLT